MKFLVNVKINLEEQKLTFLNVAVVKQIKPITIKCVLFLFKEYAITFIGKKIKIVMFHFHTIFANTVWRVARKFVCENHEYNIENCM